MFKVVYLACLFIALVAPPTLKAQTYTLSNGSILTLGPIGTTLASGYGDNSSIPNGEAGGLGGVVNLMTSGYNAVAISGFSIDPGWAAVLPLTPAQKAANTDLFDQTLNVKVNEYATGRSGGGPYTYTGIFYEPLTWTPPHYPTYYYVGFANAGSAPVASLTSNLTSFYSWFRSGQSYSTPSAPFTVVNSNSATLIWSGGQLHFINGTSDTIVPTPTGWAGDVAIVNMAEQGANLSDGWADSVYYLAASISLPPPPAGVISVSSQQVKTNGTVSVTWQLN